MWWHLGRILGTVSGRGKLQLALRWGAFATAIGLYLLALWNTAWVCDDAYISFRVSDNLVNGYGLRWNVIERVQVFTNPLWTLLNAAVYAVTREGFYTWLGVSATVSLAAYVIVLRQATSAAALMLAGVWLVFSRAFVDFSTSGLENPMTHLLVLVFLLLYLRGSAPVWLGLVAGLGAANRLDSIVLFAPALALRAWEGPFVDVVRGYLRGFAPLAAWLLFALVYYGTPFPNTAYAKLGGDIPFWERVVKGTLYLWEIGRADRVTVLGIMAGALCALGSREARRVALVAGAILYVGYLVYLGGDSLQGRFLSAPFVVCVAAVAAFPAFRHASLALPIAVLVVLVGYSVPLVSIVPSERFEARRYDLPAERLAPLGARRLMPGACVAPWKVAKDLPDLQRVREAHAAGGGPRVVKLGAVGTWGFFGGPELHIVDVMALGDPLLARLPAVYDPAWWPGHRMRHVPSGYAETVLEETSGILEPGVAALDDLVRTVTRGPLWSGDRWAAIVELHAGAWRAEIVDDEWRFAEMRRIYSAALSSAPLAEGQEERALVFGWAGAEVRFGEAQRAARIGLSLDGWQPYRLLFMRENEIVGWTDVRREEDGALGFYELEVAVPEDAIARGYDSVRIKPHHGKHFRYSYRLGHFVLLGRKPGTGIWGSSSCVTQALQEG